MATECRYAPGIWARNENLVFNASASSKVLARLCKCAVSSEPSLLAYTKYGSRGSLRPNIRPLVELDTSACPFKGG